MDQGFDLLRCAALQDIGVIGIEHVRPTVPDIFYRRFPVPWITLLFSLGARGWWRSPTGEWQRFPAATLRGHCGAWSFGCDEPGAAEYLKVLFDPFRLPSSLAFPAKEIVGSTIDATKIVRTRFGITADELSALPDGRSRISNVASRLLAKIDPLPPRLRGLQLGNVMSRELVLDAAHRHHMSSRDMRVHVRELTGQTPKAWERSWRFTEALKGLNQTSKADNEPSGIDRYYDQSHLIHEFREFTGTTPGTYKRASALGDARIYMMVEQGESFDEPPFH